MKIEIIDYGYKYLPFRAHDNDAGADVFANIKDYIELNPHESLRIPLGIGIRIPDGYAAFVYPRSGLSAKGLTCELPPIDSGYTGEIHAIVTNHSDEHFIINPGDRIGQLLIMPVIIADFVVKKGEARGTNAFGSTGI